MAYGADKSLKEASSRDQFLAQLYKRTSRLPFKAESGNELISINTRHCSKEFIKQLEALAGTKNFKLLMTGSDYYLEVMDKGAFFNALERAVFGINPI